MSPAIATSPVTNLNLAISTTFPFLFSCETVACGLSDRKWSGPYRSFSLRALRSILLKTLHCTWMVYLYIFSVTFWSHVNDVINRDRFYGNRTLSRNCGTVSDCFFVAILVVETSNLMTSKSNIFLQLISCVHNEWIWRYRWWYDKYFYNQLWL